MLDLEDVEIFVRVAALRSLSAAGLDLGLHKSVVARRLARLEAAVGSNLVRRTSRQVSLSPTGETFLPAARALIEAKEAALGLISSTQNRVDGLVRISASPTFGQQLIAPAIGRILEAHPNLRIDLTLTSERLDLFAGQTDIAIRLGALPDSELRSRTLGRLPFCLVGSPGYLDRMGRPKSPQDLNLLSFVQITTPLNIKSLKLENGSDTWTGRPRAMAAANDPAAVTAICMGGAGIAAVPCFVAAEYIAEGQLDLVLEGWAPPPLQVCLLTVAHQLPTRIRVTADLLVELLSGRPPFST
jgi:DNA-binding transcriptional LysR family regulator